MQIKPNRNRLLLQIPVYIQDMIRDLVSTLNFLGEQILFYHAPFSFIGATNVNVDWSRRLPSC